MGKEKSIEDIVKEVYEEFPQRVRDKCDGLLEIVVKKEDDDTVQKALYYQVHSGTIFGRFEGIPNEPSNIYLFEKPLRTIRKNIKQSVRNILRHEIYHFFGMTEEEIIKYSGMYDK